MLEITLDEIEFYDPRQEIFFYTRPQIVKLEHSLISISKWESKWEKPYFPGPGHPGISGYVEEVEYISCMIIGNNKDVPSNVLFERHGEEIFNYIENPYSGTKIYRVENRPIKQQTITSEIIYYWMIKFGIPFECEKWHFNRLLTLLDVCNVKESAKSNKMSGFESAKYRQELNKARRAAS